MSLKQVDVKTAHQLLTEQDHSYVDVRSIPEFENGHPAGATNVPLLHHDPQSGQMKPNAEFLEVMQANYAPETKLLIGCQMGGRSSQAGQILLAAGYQDVANVLGGFGGTRDRGTGQAISEGWADAGLPVDQGPTPGGGYEELRKKTSS
jgi:E3 ubiquitin-protein ligase RNF13